MRGQTNVILAIIVIIIVAIFAVTNVESVEVNYLFWTGTSPLILVILFSLLMGGIITAAVGAVRMYRLQREIRGLKAENQEMERLLQKHHLINTLEKHAQRKSSSSSSNDQSKE